jgi:hypothetical protein
MAAFPATWTPGFVGASAPLSAYVQQVPPSITITGPTDGSTATAAVTLTAVVDDDVPLASLQFVIDGAPVGTPLRTAPYAFVWDSRLTPGSGSHTITARATDALGRSATSSSISIGVDNGPAIGQPVASAGLTASSLRVDWTTDVLADSQVEYGATSAYGLSTPLESRMVWNHEQQITGLAPGTTYHYRVRSRDAAGVLAISADFTFTTP